MQEVRQQGAGRMLSGRLPVGRYRDGGHRGSGKSCRGDDVLSDKDSAPTDSAGFAEILRNRQQNVKLVREKVCSYFVARDSMAFSVRTACSRRRLGISGTLRS